MFQTYAKRSLLGAKSLDADLLIYSDFNVAPFFAKEFLQQMDSCMSPECRQAHTLFHLNYPVFTAWCYAERVRPSVRLTVTLRYPDHMGWKSSEIISRLVSLGCSLSADPNITDLFQGDSRNFGRNRGGVIEKRLWAQIPIANRDALVTAWLRKRDALKQR